MSAWCLALHASYRCRHSGACCRADWAIPAETHVRLVVDAHPDLARSVAGPLFVPESAAERPGSDPGVTPRPGSDPGVTPRPGSDPSVTPRPGSDPSVTPRLGSDPGGRATQAVVARRGDGSCVFLEPTRANLCAIHRTAGEHALPSACRHFPREILRDARGLLISLSHFCPTAAELLFAPGSLAIVDAEPPLRLDGAMDGLDAVGALPPLVRPGLLSDLEGYQAWEAACLSVLAQDDRTAQDALDFIAAATEDVRDWRPDDEALATRVRRAFRHTDNVPFQPFVGFADLCAAHFPPASGPVPRVDEIWDWLVEPALAPFEHVLRNYLAARLFGNWIAYQGRGLRSIVEWLRTALAVLRNELARRVAASGRPPVRSDILEAVRATDLLLLHTVDSEAIARRFALLEGPDPS